jgi:AcrR family transcriptional regulator
MPVGSPPLARVLPLHGAGERPSRVDAARNRDRVLTAAREAFAEYGSEAQMEDIARRAGVGVGTVYRHFQTKDALIDALLTARFTQLADRLRLSQQVKDSWDAIVLAFQVTAELQAQDRCLVDALAQRKALFTESAPVMTELRAIWGELLQRGQRQGVIRPDVSVEDIPSLMWGLASVVGRANHSRVWERYVGLLLDGLRAAPVRSTLAPLS